MPLKIRDVISKCNDRSLYALNVDCSERVDMSLLFSVCWNGLVELVMHNPYCPPMNLCLPSRIPNGAMPSPTITVLHIQGLHEECVKRVYDFVAMCCPLITVLSVTARPDDELLSVGLEDLEEDERIPLNYFDIETGPMMWAFFGTPCDHLLNLFIQLNVFTPFERQIDLSAVADIIRCANVLVHFTACIQNTADTVLKEKEIANTLMVGHRGGQLRLEVHACSFSSNSLNFLMAPTKWGIHSPCSMKIPVHTLWQCRSKRSKNQIVYAATFVLETWGLPSPAVFSRSTPLVAGHMGVDGFGHVDATPSIWIEIPPLLLPIEYEGECVKYMCGISDC
jgi:hypothetical protein